MPQTSTDQHRAESDFIAQLSEAEKQFLENKSYKKFYHKNAIIHSPGDKTYHVTHVISGRVKIYNITVSGKEVIYRFCGKDSFFGIAEICGGERREVFAEAIEDTHVWCLDREDFLELLKNNYKLAFFALKVLGDRLHQAHRAIQSLAIQDTNSRLAYLLLKLAKMSHGPMAGSAIEHRLTHQELANMIGATRTTVTELLSDYKAKQYIEYVEGKIRILDIESLRGFAED